MAGYWGNPNFYNPASNAGQYLQPTPLLPGLPSMHGLGPAGIEAARNLLAAAIPPPTGAFLSNAQGQNIRTTSKVTLPPSLSKKRKKNTSENGIGSIPPTTLPSQANPSTSNSETGSSNTNHTRYANDVSGNGISDASSLSTSTQPQLPTFDVLSVRSKTAQQSTSEAETPTPVFSTEIGMGKECPASKQEQPVQSILLDHSNSYSNKLLPHGAHRILHNNDFWHKFIITGPVAGNKTKILKRILESCEPFLLLPVMYQEEGDTAVFYGRNCGSAIDRLFRNNNMVFELNGQRFRIRILLQCASVNRLKINASSVLRNILEKRYNSSDRCLDLSNFEHDPDLASSMYCPLSQPSILHYVLSTAILTPINFNILRLRYNGIRQLKLEMLQKASYLRTLDLSHNELLYQIDLEELRELNQITKLILDGNPLCAEFRTAEEYIGKIKAVMPQLRALDTVPLYPGGIVVPKEKNFLCSKDGHQMVDQFLKHFFDRYDWKDRRCLDGLYHSNALFSLTCVHLSGQSTSEGSSLTWYTTYNHNLVKVSDYSKAEKNVYNGPDEILELFSSLPATEHDPYSFSVDLMHYNDRSAVISVNGVFREQPSLPPEPDYMRSFRRVFVLSCTGLNEWQIINEQLHISNLTTDQVESAFKIRRPPVETPVAAWLIQDAQLLSDAEKEQMACIMMQLTTLNKEWATKFLKESHWYVREALIAFVNKFEAKELPEEAFGNS